MGGEYAWQDLQKLGAWGREGEGAPCHPEILLLDNRFLCRPDQCEFPIQKIADNPCLSAISCIKFAQWPAPNNQQEIVHVAALRFVIHLIGVIRVFVFDSMNLSNDGWNWLEKWDRQKWGPALRLQDI